MSVSPTTQPGIIPQQLPHDVLVEQKQGQAILIWTIGSFCIFGWELLICLPQEYQLIWKKPINVSSVLYIVNRYFGIVQFSFVVSLISGAWTQSACTHIFFFKPIGGLISTILSQIILGGRVYVIFSQSKPVAFTLLSLLLTEVVVCAIGISKIYPPAFSGPAEIPGPPCGVLVGPFGWLVTFWTMPLLFDTVTFLLTAWKAHDMWKKQMKVGTHDLFDIIWRDGLLYFFAIFAMNIVNVVIFLTTSKTLRAVNLPATLSLQVVLSCRLVLNLRASHARLVSGPNRISGGDNVKMRALVDFREATVYPTETAEIGYSYSSKLPTIKETSSEAS